MAPTETQQSTLAQSTTATETADHSFTTGTFARDTEEEAVVLVVGTPDVQADECEIPELGGLTPAECFTNRDYPAADPVVEVVYTSALNHEFGNGEWSIDEVLARHVTGDLGDVTVYSMPDSRLETAGQRGDDE